jgi:excisionase family DNA binding protein
VADPSDQQWFTLEQAAGRLQVTKQTVYNWINLGILAYYELPTGRGRRFRRDDLDRLLQPRGGENVTEQGLGPTHDA